MEVYAENRDDVLYIRYNKEFSIRNIKDVEVIWEKAKEDNIPLVVFDCKGLEFIDSSAIGTLVKYFNEAGNFNIKMVIINTSDAILKIFKTAKLSRLFVILTEDQFRDEYIVNKKRHDTN
ncbi:MAG TPA: STAS domain-containing protein [Spirochaetota bacterium]|nr:STAS domain-containing protein [Spirochaetota bacterium]HPI89291.1 STAS domain-containing protein [Spirochaetota bacterium]HPR47889.1 STAS domain-containing protein [Spirochaetota bacterium]